MAFEFAGLAYRNPGWVTRNARRAWATAKAMQAYREAHPACEYCGRDSRIQVHHAKPVSVAPDLAASIENMISLCAKRCHITIGHAGNYKNYVENVFELCARRRVIKTEAA
jgi:hypothetical protein